MQRDEPLNFNALLLVADDPAGWAENPTLPEFLRAAHAEIERLSAAPPSPWMEIDENTPRDRFLLIYCPEDQSRWLAKWQGRGDDTEWYGVDDEGLTRGSAWMGFTPTHWQELPAPPPSAPQATPKRDGAHMSIAELRTRVAEATGADRALDTAVEEFFFADAPKMDGWQGTLPYTESLDVALALVEQKLPGWRKQLFENDDGWSARLIRTSPYAIATYGDAPSSPRARSAPLAVLSALLSALAESDRTEKAV